MSFLQPPLYKRNPVYLNFSRTLKSYISELCVICFYYGEKVNLVYSLMSCCPVFHPNPLQMVQVHLSFSSFWRITAFFSSLIPVWNISHSLKISPCAPFISLQLDNCVCVCCDGKYGGKIKNMKALVLFYSRAWPLTSSCRRSELPYTDQ